MATPADRKLYLGPRLRVLRRELGLNQTSMAAELGVSPSYLNHLERNQRPVTAQILLRLANTYDIDVRAFVATANEAAASDLHEMFADELVRDIGIPRHEIMEIAENHPSVAEAMTRLYRALGDLRRMPDRMDGLAAGAAQSGAPLDWLREHLDQKRNHFADLDGAAETLSATLGDTPDALREAMLRRLREDHGVTVRVVPQDVLAQAVRHYDYHRRHLLLSERLPPASRLFGIAYHFALETLAEPIVETVARAAAPDRDAAILAKIAFANYAAAALLMPYARFQRTAQDARYDMDMLCARFGASYEQVAHRLTTLDRSAARGVPFFLLKIDTAGNIAKRHAGEAMPIARFGGGCPRWHVQRAFRLAGETIVQAIETPDGSRYVSFARAVPRTAGEGLMTIVLGCDARHAGALAAMDRLAQPDAPTPIGPACHLCERRDCPERALPPVMRTIDLNQFRRAATPYPFRPI